MRALTLCARADLEVDRVALRPIDEMMTVSDPSLETRGVARLQHGRATVLDQHDLALEDVNELVFGLVPWPGVTEGREKAALLDDRGLTQFGANLTRLKPTAASALRHANQAAAESVYGL